MSGDGGWLRRGSASGGLLATHVGGFIMIFGGFFRTERVLELGFIDIANIHVEQREQPGITE